MNQCVPSWDFDQNPTPVKMKFHAHSNSSNSLLPDVPSMDYEVAELTWENGQLAMHGLGVPRVANKPIASSSPGTWDKPHGGGTLESLVNQATGHPQPKAAAGGGGDNINELVPWFDPHSAVGNPGASAPINTMDALVPCNNNTRRKDNQEPSAQVRDGGMGISRAAGCSTRVGSCSAAAAPTLGGVGGRRVARVGSKTYRSVSESATCGGRESHQVTLDTWDGEQGGASLVSPENTFSGQECTRTSADDHDSISRSRSQRKSGDEEGSRKGKYASSTKRSRAAAIHNQSERKRRDKINQRMKTLQKLVPNSSKTDKASMLDEVIEYLKQLQAQVHMMNRPSMMLPLAMQQHLQMMGMSMGMGMGMMGMGVLDINTINRAAGVPPVMPPPAAFMPMPPPSWDNSGDSLHPPPPGSVLPDPFAAILACQSQPTTMEAYSRLAAMYQQLQQQPPVSKN